MSLAMSFAKCPSCSLFDRCVKWLKESQLKSETGSGDHQKPRMIGALNILDALPFFTVGVNAVVVLSPRAAFAFGPVVILNFSPVDSCGDLM